MTMTSTHLVSLLSTTKTLTCLKQLHANLLKAGLDADPFVAGKLLLRSATSLPYALRLFRHFPNPDAFMYNTLIRALADSDTPLHSLALFADMRKEEAGPNPDSFTFAFSIKAAANSGCFSGGSQLHCQALAHGFNGHIFVWTTLVSMYGECGCVGYARKVFDEIPDPNVVAWNALLTVLCRGGDVEGAREVFGLMPVRDSTSWNVVIAGHARAGEMGAAEMAFREMPVKDDVSWSTMIAGFARNGFFDEAFGFFRELIGEGVRTNEVSLTGVLSACAQAGALDLAKVVHGVTGKLGVDWIVSVNNTLIDAYSKCGNVDMARLVFEEMPEKGNVVTWTTMLAGLAMYGHGKEALELFYQMEESGVRPDGITFISLFYACSHAGMIEKGRMYFDKMRESYGIEPDFEHYGCMVDLYGRAGHLQKAYAFACQMPFPPNAVIWRTLLGACSIHGDVELAEKVKSKISVVDPGDSSDFVLLSNVYAASGKWKNVASMRRSMANHAMKKTPGWSMIEVDKLTYTFFAGAKQDDITDEAYEMLKEIMQRLRVEGGYVPHVGTVLYDVEEEEKEDPLTRHSEKLAVAFGVLRLCKGRAIRIVKNLRICMDCHTVMKLISRIYKLEIVVRDRSRFHSFRDGSCSCNDYW